MNSLRFHTSHHSSRGFTSLVLATSFTDGLLNEEQICRATELATGVFVRSISESIVGNAAKDRRQRADETASLGDSVDEIIEQVLRQGSHLSAV